MAKRDRDQEKKRRRQKRLQKQQRKQKAPELDRVMHSLMQHLKVPEPSRWPGASDPSLSRPDRVKFELATFATSKGPGKSKALLLEKNLKKGLLEFLPELDHWALEEFIWHGLPGDSWHPVEAFLAHEGDRFPPPAQEQLRRWKQATLGTFEVGDIESAGIKPAWSSE